MPCRHAQGLRGVQKEGRRRVCVGHTRSEGACTWWGEHAGTKGCVHTVVTTGVKGSLHAGMEMCTHTGGGCMCARVCVYSGGAEVCMSPNGTFSPPRLRRRCVTPDTLLPGGSRAAPAPARAVQSRQRAWLPGELLSSPSFGRRHFLIPARRFPLLGLVPLLPTAPPGAALNCLPPASRRVCRGVWVCLFIGLLQSQRAAKVPVAPPTRLGSLPSFPGWAHVCPHAPVPADMQISLQKEFITRVGSGALSQQHHPCPSARSSAPCSQLAQPRCSLQACLRSCCWVKLPSPAARVS